MTIFLLGMLDIKSPTGKYEDLKRYESGQWLRGKLGRDVKRR